ncbi:MAG: extracellular solute-binding protein [Acidobacteriaceae bacterium]|nr:extracellular solute-binding protein [Acidobacteriaceae bacterium]
MSQTRRAERGSRMIELRGITWNHTRGYLPMVATAQRFSELHPNVSIHWEKRSLQQFADYPLERLVEKYDLLVIDHPFVGYAACHDVLLPLDEYLPAEFLADQARNSVGLSHESYSYAGHQWALAIDAATPICGYRPDLLEKNKLNLPRNWEELVELAARGLVVVSGIGIDSLCHFYMLCGALGYEPFSRAGTVVSEAVGVQALQLVRKLIDIAVPGSSERNPIAVWELLTSDNTAAVCPFAYGYSNYGRRSYCKYPLRFTRLIEFNGRRCRSTLGGAGLAISVHCKAREPAADYCLFTASEASQSGIYFTSGGQPGYRKAWLDDSINAESNNFFEDTLCTLDDAWRRPRWNAYLSFQDGASDVMSQYIRHTIDEQTALARMNKLLATVREGAAR